MPDLTWKASVAITFSLAALCVPVSPILPPQTLTHTPWWHVRGHLSDYTTCQPGPEGDCCSDLAQLASGSHQHQREARCVKGAQYRDEFLNVANEVPELAAMFLPDDMQAEMSGAGRPSRLPLALHAGSLYQRLSSLYREQMSGHSMEAASGEVDTSLGYKMMRIWLDEVYGELGGARGRHIVQRVMSDSGRFAVPTGLAEECESSYFFLPDFLCAELHVDPNLQGPQEVGRGHSNTGKVHGVSHIETPRIKGAESRTTERPRRGKQTASRKARRKAS